MVIDQKERDYLKQAYSRQKVKDIENAEKDKKYKELKRDLKVARENERLSMMRASHARDNERLDREREYARIKSYEDDKKKVEDYDKFKEGEKKARLRMIGFRRGERESNMGAGSDHKYRVAVTENMIRMQQLKHRINKVNHAVNTKKFKFKGFNESLSLNTLNKVPDAKMKMPDFNINLNTNFKGFDKHMVKKGKRRKNRKNKKYKRRCKW